MIKAQTPRLILRPFTPDDWSDVHELALDWSTAPGPAFDKWPTTEPETRGLTGHFVSRGDQYAAVCVCETGKVIGLVSVQVSDQGDREIGHVFLRSVQDNSIDREALAAAVEHAFQTRQASTIITHNAPEHEEQLAPLKALGFRSTNPADRGELVLARTDWEKTGSPG